MFTNFATAKFLHLHAKKVTKKGNGKAQNFGRYTYTIQIS